MSNLNGDQLIKKLNGKMCALVELHGDTVYNVLPFTSSEAADAAFEEKTGYSAADYQKYRENMKASDETVYHFFDNLSFEK